MAQKMPYNLYFNPQFQFYSLVRVYKRVGIKYRALQPPKNYSESSSLDTTPSPCTHPRMGSALFKVWNLHSSEVSVRPPKECKFQNPNLADPMRGCRTCPYPQKTV